MLTHSSHWKWPKINGLHDVQGELIHSANWPESFEYANKTVALIGNGSSGLQILPELQKRQYQSLRHLDRLILHPRVQRSCPLYP